MTKQIFYRSLIVLATVGGLFGFFEAGIRIYLRLQNGKWEEARATTVYRANSYKDRIYRRHAYLNFSPREGGQVQAFGKSASFNSMGYRSPERPIEKPPGVLRVVCSGGSTTFDILAKNNEASWPWLLEGYLQEQGLSIQVWNAGFPGWTSLENLISLSIRDVDLLPDVVVLYQGINDLQPAFHTPFDSQYEIGHADIALASIGFHAEPPTWYQKSLLVEKSRDTIFDSKKQSPPT